MTTNGLSVSSAHSPGSTQLAFSPDGRRLYTGGSDCLVRIWEADPVAGAGKEPKFVEEAKDPITSISCSRTVWASSSEDCSVRLYDVQTDDLKSLVTRSVGVAVRSVAFSPDGKMIAVTSDELHVKVIDIEDTTRISLLEGHKKGVRSVTWHPLGTFLTTAGQEGNVIVWDVSSHPKSALEPLKSFADLTPAVDPDSEEFSYDVSAVWHPSGKYFAIAGRTHDILFVARASWTINTTISHSQDGHASDITSLAFSSNGNYLASAGSDGLIIIWDPAAKTALFRHTPKVTAPAPTCLAFSPSQNLLAWVDTDGSLTRWMNPIPSSHPSPTAKEKEKEKSKSKSTTTVDKVEANRAKFNDLFGDELGTSEAVGDGGDDGDEDADPYDDDWIIDDVGRQEKDEKERDRMERAGLREMVNVTKAQPAFQPGSTPFRNKKRFLAFNMIGVIEVTDQDTHQIVNVEFHDKATRRGYHFQDHFRFTMASLGPRGAVYATPSQPSSSGPAHASQITYKPYESWASSSTTSSEWQISLPAGEDAVAIAAGGKPLSKSSEDEEGDIVGGMGSVVVATSRGYVRFYSGAGLQRYVWNLGAEVVSVVAGAEWAFVVHREGGTSLDGCQNLRYNLISLDSFDIIQDSRVPLRKGVVLQWVGISDEGLPAMYDSTGVLSILDRFRRPTQGRWVPALDTNILARRKGKEESYWPVGVSEKEMWCIILKGSEEYPGFPRPLIQEIEVQMPFSNLDVPQGQIEEKYLREEIQLQIQRDALPSDLSTNPDIHQRELNLDKAIITLIQTACKADKLQRALDLTNMLHHLNSFDTAQKVAQFYHLIGLQEKMGMLKRQREKSLDGEEEPDVRKGWGRVSAPVKRNFNPNEDRDRGSVVFQDFLPPPVITRRSLAPARPISAQATSAPTKPFSDPDRESFHVTDDSLPSEPDSFSFSAFSDIVKRKRDDDDPASDDDADKEDGPSEKKRAVVESIVKKNDAVKSTANPFARKAGLPTAVGAAPAFNPFARKNGAKPPLVTTKSNSFFDKVDAAENGDTKVGQPSKRIPVGKEKGKDESKKEVARQTTLFGLPLGAEKKGKGKGGKGKEPSDGRDASEPIASEEVASVPAPTVSTSALVGDDMEGVLASPEEMESTQLGEPMETDMAMTAPEVPTPA